MGVVCYFFEVRLSQNHFTPDIWGLRTCLKKGSDPLEVSRKGSDPFFKHVLSDRWGRVTLLASRPYHHETCGYWSESAAPIISPTQGKAFSCNFTLVKHW